MPARIVLVHDEPVFANALAARLGPEVAWFTDPIKALAALETAKTIQFLIARLVFDNQQPIGLSLARMARAARPEVRVIFTGKEADREFARGLGEFLVEPIAPQLIAVVMEWLTDRRG